MPNKAYYDNEKITEQVLQKYLDSNIREERIKAIHYLMTAPSEDAIEKLKKLLFFDPDPVVREMTITALSNFNFEEQLGLYAKIIKGTSERNNFVRARAVWAISRTNSPTVYNILMKGIIDDHQEVQYWSIIGLLNQKTAAFPFQDLNQLLASHKNHFIRQAIVWVFGMIGDVKAVKVLIDVLIKEKNPQVRITATWALRKINDCGSISGLIYALKNELNELAKRELVLTIGSILTAQSKNDRTVCESYLNSRKEAIHTLLMVLQRDTCYYIRRACAEALGKINDIEAVQVLITTYTSDVNQFVRREIAQTLGILGDERALPVLRKSLRSHYKYVVIAAKAAIEQILSADGKN